MSLCICFRCWSHPGSPWWKPLCSSPQERLPGRSCHHQWPPSPWKPLDKCREPIETSQPPPSNHWPDPSCDRPRLPPCRWPHPLCEQRLRELDCIHQDWSYWWAQPVLTECCEPQQPSSDPPATQPTGEERARPASEWPRGTNPTSLPVHVHKSRRRCPTPGPSASACQRGPHKAGWRPFNRGARDRYSWRRTAQQSRGQQCGQLRHTFIPGGPGNTRWLLPITGAHK